MAEPKLLVPLRPKEERTSSMSKSEQVLVDYNAKRGTFKTNNPVQTPELDAAVGNSPDFSAPSVSEPKGLGERVGRTVLGAGQQTLSSAVEAGRGIWDFLSDSYKYGETEESAKREDKVSPLLMGYADKQADKSARNIATAKQGLGTVGQFLVDAGVAGTQMAADVGIAALTGGSSLAPMAVRSFGSGIQQARNKGYDVNQQMALGLGNAATEWATEKLFGGNPLYDAANSGVVNKVISRVTQNENILKFLASRPIETLNEGLEEILSGVINPAIELAITGNADWPTVEELIRDGAIGIALGGAGQVVNAVANRGNESSGNPLFDALTSKEQNAATGEPATAEELVQDARKGKKTRPAYTAEDGPVPQNTNTDPQSTAIISNEALNQARESVSGGETLRDQRNFAEKYLKPLFDRLGGVRRFPINGVSFEGGPYEVTVYKNAINKIISDYDFGVEKIAVFLDLQNILSGSRYAGSGKTFKYDKDGNPVPSKNNQSIRHDYFTAPVQFPDGSTKTVQIDVEVLKGENKYRTHHVVNGIELLDDTSAPGITRNVRMSPSNSSISIDNIPQNSSAVNGSAPYHPINEVGAASAQATYGRDPVQVPVTNFEGHLTSKTSSTIINSGLTPNGVAQSLTELLNKGEMSRIRFTDADAVADAKQTIAEKGFAKALEEFRIDVANGQRGKDLMARGIELFNMAAQSGDIMTATDIAVDIVDSAREQAQAIQVLNLFNKATPEGRVYFAVKGMDKLISKMEKKYGDRAKGINVNEELLADYYEAVKSGNEQAIKETWQEVQKDVAAQIPANWADKFRAWRYLAMLGNPKTHIRNVAGNVVFMPARYAKNVIGAGLEKVSGTSDRTKAVLNPLSAQDRQLMQLAWQDYAAAMDGTDTGRYDESTNDIDRMRQVLPGALDKVAKWNTEQMAKEDRWFSRPAYMDALAGWFKANNITTNQAADMMAGANAETFAKAREYAILEAKKATFQDVNAFSDAVSRFGRSSKGGRFLMDSVLPFKRTPANVLMRAAEYSPAYLMKGLKEVAMDVPAGKMSAAEAIDHLASGLTGSGIMGLGFLLAKMGLLRGSGSDDEKQAAFDKLQGKQDYSLAIGDTSFTIDWMAPAALPLFVGAELYELMTQGEGENATLEDYLSTLLGIADPILETSMLSGINELIDSVGYSDRPMLDVVKNIAFNYLGSFLPTVGGQIERMGDENRQETYRYNESDFLSDSQYDVANLLNKIPFVDAPGQIDYVDAWGRTQENTNPLFNQLFNPSYVSTERTSEVETELQRLYDRGQGNVFPKRRGQGEEINVLDEDGEFVKSRHLTAEEYEQFNRTKGQTSLRLISDLMETNFYRTASDSEKAKAIENIYTYANAVAMMEAEPTTKVDSWITKARDSSDPGKYIQLYTATQNIEPVPGNENPSTWQKVEYIVGNVSTKDADEFIPLYLDDLGPRRYEMAREHGYTPEMFMQAYKAKRTVVSDRDENGKSLKNTKEKYIQYLMDEYGWPEANAEKMYGFIDASEETLNNWKW